MQKRRTRAKKWIDSGPALRVRTKTPNVSRTRRAVVLLSGGLDSATALYQTRQDGYACYCLCVDYGQRHRKEIRCAERIARYSGSHFLLIRTELPWKKSALVNPRIPLPDQPGVLGRKDRIPRTYVPARNSIFLSIAAGWAEDMDAARVVIGANAVDYSGYPDCRPDFLKAFNHLIEKGTRRGAEGNPVHVYAPLLLMKKADIIQRGMQLGVPYECTWSCYRGGERPCGRCDSCRIRRRGFREAGMRDPLLKR